MESKEEQKKPDDMVGATRHKLTLSSHGGKAIVKKDKDFKHEGHDVYYFELGNSEQAIEVEISKNFADA